MAGTRIPFLESKQYSHSTPQNLLIQHFTFETIRDKSLRIVLGYTLDDSLDFAEVPLTLRDEAAGLVAEASKLGF